MSNENTPVDAPNIGEEKKTEKRPRSKKKNPGSQTDAAQEAASADGTPTETKTQPRRMKKAARSSLDAEISGQKAQRRPRKVHAAKAVAKVTEGDLSPKKRKAHKKISNEPSEVPKETVNAVPSDGQTDTSHETEMRHTEEYANRRIAKRLRRGKKQEIPPPKAFDTQSTPDDLAANVKADMSSSLFPEPPLTMMTEDTPSPEPPDETEELVLEETANDEPAPTVDLEDPWEDDESAPNTRQAQPTVESGQFEDWDDEAPPPLPSGTVATQDDWDDSDEIRPQKKSKRVPEENEAFFDSSDEEKSDSLACDAEETKPKKHQRNKSNRSRNKQPHGDAQESALREDTSDETDKTQVTGNEDDDSAYEAIHFLDEDEEDGETKRKEGQPQRKANRKMFFSVLAGERIEVALTQEGKLCEYYLDMQHQKKLKGNIYKGIIQNIDANLQAAFVDYGTMKNGFLQIDEIHSEYWLAHHEPTKGNKFPPIQKVIKPGQEVLVQVVKEPTGNKGAFLTTWLSLAGRFLVLTPGQDQIGVSRKVEDEAERARLKELINGIDPGEGMGVIVRTVSEGTTKETLRKDLMYLKRIWQEIREKGTEVKAPALIYSEPGLVERSIRDYLTEDVSEIWVDSEEVAETIHSMVDLLFPRKQDMVHLFIDKKQSLWDRFTIRRQIEQVYAREVFLPSGGRLVFDQTEALMAIDVNSGKISCKGNFETMAYKTNMEAAESIARQLRLRDVGGQIVIDFIEMREKKHVEDVERSLRLAMKSDRARYDIEHMSSFGLLELVRQRTGFSALSITQEPCPFCSGTGQRRNLEWQALQVASDIQRQMRSSRSQHCIFETNPELGMYLLNHKREMLQELEQMFGKTLEISIHRSL